MSKTPHRLRISAQNTVDRNKSSSSPNEGAYNDVSFNLNIKKHTAAKLENKNSEEKRVHSRHTDDNDNHDQYEEDNNCNDGDNNSNKDKNDEKNNDGSEKEEEDEDDDNEEKEEEEGEKDDDDDDDDDFVEKNLRRRRKVVSMKQKHGDDEADGDDDIDEDDEELLSATKKTTSPQKTRNGLQSATKPSTGRNAMVPSDQQSKNLRRLRSNNCREFTRKDDQNKLAGKKNNFHHNQGNDDDVDDDEFQIASAGDESNPEESLQKTKKNGAKKKRRSAHSLDSDLSGNSYDHDNFIQATLSEELDDLIEDQEQRKDIIPLHSKRKLNQGTHINAESHSKKRSSLQTYRMASDLDDDNSCSSSLSQVPYETSLTRKVPAELPALEGTDLSKLNKNEDYTNFPMALPEDQPEFKSLFKSAKYRNISRIANAQSMKSSKSKSNDIQPVKLDFDLSWDNIGGLKEHIRTLKEMVFLPLMYPEVFQKFHMEPPKGVLFYGPPGTGKTLCARALAASCGSVEENETNDAGVQTKIKKPRVSFFVRNGADCLSKWVGEAERQLRQTFEIAKQNQPAIIFFDEIDGLAPVRSSRQDQIHSSIVSTLLGLMDGLDSRGQIVIIGATNRVDAIDPALRRPGRFDRELIFPLPNMAARQQIIKIHTEKWNPPIDETTQQIIAEKTVGYCGADLRSLASEAAMLAVRGRYPQIYSSNQKFLIDPNEVKVSLSHFLAAMKTIVPASRKSTRIHGKPIKANMMCLLYSSYQKCIETLEEIFEAGFGAHDAFNEKQMEIREAILLLQTETDSLKRSDELQMLSYDVDSKLYQPRLLVCGHKDFGQNEIGLAILNRLEGCPVYAIDIFSLCSDPNAKSPEEALNSAIREAMRATPSILYLPHICTWWESASDILRLALLTALQDIPSNLPVLVLAISDVPLKELPQDIKGLFFDYISLEAPSSHQRKLMFEDLFKKANESFRFSNVSLRKIYEQRKFEKLPLAPLTTNNALLAKENEGRRAKDEMFIRELRMQMREIIERLLADRKFQPFWEPVDLETAPDYLSVVKHPVDLSLIAANIDSGRYAYVVDMVADIDLMVKNAVDYNPAHVEDGAAIIRKAHAIVDIVHAWADTLDENLLRECSEIVARRLNAVQNKKNLGTADKQEKHNEVEEIHQKRGNPDVGNSDGRKESNENESRACTEGVDIIESNEKTLGKLNGESQENMKKLITEHGKNENVVDSSSGEKYLRDGKAPQEDIDSVISSIVDKTEGWSVHEIEYCYTAILRIVQKNFGAMSGKDILSNIALNLSQLVVKPITSEM